MNASINLRYLKSLLPYLGALALPLAGIACSSGASQETVPGAESRGYQSARAIGKADGDVPAIPDEAKAVVEVYAMDIWGRLLPEDETALEVHGRRSKSSLTAGPVRYLPLTETDTVTLRLSASGHAPAEVSVSFDGTGALEGLSAELVGDDARQGFCSSRQVLAYGEQALPTISLYLGLRHNWFSSQGRPPRAGNRIELFMDGEAGWGQVYADLDRASASVLLSTWWWESDFELVRPADTHHLLNPEVRWGNTILGVLERSPAHKRILVGQFWGQDSIFSWITTDAKLRAHAEASNDGFEFMGMANETHGQFYFEPASFSFGERVREQHEELVRRDLEHDDPIESNVPSRYVDMTDWPVSVDFNHASYHQKFVVVDDEVAYVGGMNLTDTDWDTSEHEVFEHRRMRYGASEAARAAVMDRERLPDKGPRKDYVLRVEGPAAQDVADVFKRRWDLQLDESADYADRSTPFEVGRHIAPRPSGATVQVTATLPQPLWEHAIAESWLNAVAQAESFILIEDQYFRMPMINEAIAARMDEVPSLQLIVITKPTNDWTDPACEWTARSHELFSTRFPTRYRTFRLRSFDTVVTWGANETESRFADIDIHSKMLIIDDFFMSVGSCNKNNRGIVYEGELNVAVLDREWVGNERRRILENMLPAGTQVSDDVQGWIAQLTEAAAWNDAVFGRWEEQGHDISLDGAPLPETYGPRGFVYSLSFPNPSDCLIEGMGPDITSR